MSEYSAHKDSFARENLPPRSDWPAFVHLDALGYPARMNAASMLLDSAVTDGDGERRCLHFASETWSYARLLDQANRIANVLVHDLGLVSGERVLIRAPNNPMMVACWFAVLKAGGIAVSTMPLLRARELGAIVDKAQVRLALCDARLGAELESAKAPSLERTVHFGGAELEALMAKQSSSFTNVDTAADDVALIAFTSGTTGKPKGTVHFHRDLLATCDTYGREILRACADDVFVGSPPLAFTFGLGGLVLFPMRVRASTLLLEQAPPDKLLEAIRGGGASIMFTSPTAYRAMLEMIDAPLPGLRKCVSAGETLPLPTYEAWRERTGLSIMDGIGSTEMLHIFIASQGADIRPGATGRPVPGYEARVVDDHFQTVAPGEVGRLAVRGPTGCRYLADPRQKDYVVDGWNVTGDAYRMDADGYFWFQARNDDMIISSGYNIAGPEVEEALLSHTAVAECAVVASPDDKRGNIVKAYVVTRAGVDADAALIKALQEHVKQIIAPYKYPRAIEFVNDLPRTETGKVQRFKLRQREQQA